MRCVLCPDLLPAFRSADSAEICQRLVIDQAADMGWSEEVHLQRLAVARRSANRSARGLPPTNKGNSSLGHLGLVAGEHALLT